VYFHTAQVTEYVMFSLFHDTFQSVAMTCYRSVLSAVTNLQIMLQPGRVCTCCEVHLVAELVKSESTIPLLLFSIISCLIKILNDFTILLPAYSSCPVSWKRCR